MATADPRSLSQRRKSRTLEPSASMDAGKGHPAAGACSGHDCMDEVGLAAQVESALSGSLRGVLLTTLGGGGTCPRAQAHLMDLCKVAELGKLCAGSFHVGHHSTAQIVSTLMHLVIQLIAFPPPRCTAECGTQEGGPSPAKASLGTQTEAVSTESHGCQTQGVATESVHCQASPGPMQEAAAQATPSTCDGPDGGIQVDICPPAKPRYESSVSVQVEAETYGVGVQAECDSRSRFTQTDAPEMPKSQPTCPRCEVNPVRTWGDICEDCIFFCSICHICEVDAPGDICPRCTPSRPRSASRESKGVRIGGGYDILHVDTKEQLADETRRSPSPHRDEAHRFAKGAPPAEADTTRYGVGSYTLGTGHPAAHILASHGSTLPGGLQASSGLGQQLYRVMLPALRSPGSLSSRGRRPMSAPGGGVRQVLPASQATAAARLDLVDGGDYSPALNDSRTQSDQRRRAHTPRTLGELTKITAPEPLPLQDGSKGGGAALLRDQFQS